MGTVEIFRDCFETRQPAIGMVHLLPLPGSPGYRGNLDLIYERARDDAVALRDAGFDGMLVENFGDEPYLAGAVRLETATCMAAIAKEIAGLISVPLGINVQFNAWKDELAIAMAVQASFTRVEVFVDTSLSSLGLVPPCAAEFCRYRHDLDLSVLAFADIHTKYTRSLYPSDLETSARRATEAGADALIVTGEATGKATPLDAVEVVKSATSLPVLVGSGVQSLTVGAILKRADGLIVGSSIKEGKNASNPVSPSLAREFMGAVRAARGEGTVHPT